jgi:hypothetical protein
MLELCIYVSTREACGGSEPQASWCVAIVVEMYTVVLQIIVDKYIQYINKKSEARERQRTPENADRWLFYDLSELQTAGTPK